jgi:biotin operon repressor
MGPIMAGILRELAKGETLSTQDLLCRVFGPHGGSENELYAMICQMRKRGIPIESVKGYKLKRVKT